MSAVDNRVEALQESIEEIWQIAQGFGLDPYPVHFEIVPASIIYEFGAYGLPGRFSHWTHGKAYHQMKTMYDYGLSKIYELVINSNPCYAFLLEGNSILQNKLVIAHVLAHSDFFKNNVYFGPTNRQMVESASVSAERIRGYEFEHGTDEVEGFLDAVLSIQEHIDTNVFVKKKTAEQCEEERRHPPKQTSPYDDLFSLDPDWQRPGPPAPRKFPAAPERDFLHFIMSNAAGLEDWQREIIAIVRSEAYYFLPQIQTKIMNEGWAAYWHMRILREMNLTAEESIEFAKLHSGVVSPSRRSINPYLVGLKIFEDIEKRWDQPTDEEREKFGRPGDDGRATIFEIRSQENDASFLRNYLTKQLIEDLGLYLYKLVGDEWKIVEKNWENIYRSIVSNATGLGQPYIVVEDGDHRRNRELLLTHSYEGQELDLQYAELTLHHIFRLWGRTVHLETVVDNRKILLSYDGEKNNRSFL
ncbi:MAG: SpoVR family protein [Chloroflexi bacterium]|nr:SpoVR family protein [Chloroflexota bacterium]